MSIPIERARKLIELKRYKEALTTLHGSSAEYQNDSYYYELSAQCYLELEELEKAKQAIDRGLELAPNNTYLLGALTLYYERRDKYNKALSTIDTALELDPEDTWLVTSKARVLTSLRRLSEAQTIIDHGLSIDPVSSELLTMQAILFIERGKNDEALAYTNQALAIAPTNETLIALRAQLLITVKNYDTAEKNAVQALQIDPDDEFARFTLLEVYKNKNAVLRFFVGNSFNRYFIKWSLWRVLLAIVLWKAVLFWGGLFLLYLLVTWYGGVLFNTFTRLHRKYKLLLTTEHIQQSNYFIALNATLCIVGLLLYFGAGDQSILTSLLFLIILVLFIGLSYFEISYSGGRWSFWFFNAVAAIPLFLFFQDSFTFATLSLFTLMLYAFLFTFRVISY